jgi:hypothetical protein|tara:strand:- start:289 stop:717 length:429 start_codon:yes stop_codon:yes gene_type:complete
MNDEYTSALFDVVKESSAKRGYDLPEPIEAYIVMLLASYVDKPDFLPEQTFGQMFFKLKTTDEAKNLGDTCLFVAGVFPSIGERHGINRRYYQDIGSTSYEMVAGARHPELFNTLATHFNFLSEFIETTIHSSKDVQSIFFR